MTSKVELSYSDKEFAVIYQDQNRESAMRIYNLKACIAWGKKEGSPQYEREIKAPRDHIINDVKWGALDQSIYYCTDAGRLIRYDTVLGKLILAGDIHRNEIFTLTLTKDFTMLFSSSRDGTCKLLHPETFEEIRPYQFDFPCRNAAVSPLYEAEDNQKFHVLLCGG